MDYYSKLQSSVPQRLGRSSGAKGFAALILAANLLTTGPLKADEADNTDRKSKETDTIAVADDTRFKSEAIPAYLEKLQLTEKQQEQIKTVIHDYNGSIAKVWQQFSDRYLQTIVVESSLLAAIEDNFTEQQRQRIRELRRRTAQHEKSLAASDAPSEPTTTKPADPVEDAITGVGVSLSAEQQEMAEKVEEKYRSQLRSLNRDIQGFHARLLSLEADKLVAIEKLLTKEQLTELRTNRQSRPEVVKTSARGQQPPKTE